MDISELFLACRKGDLSKVQYLVEQKEVELNIRDNWDSTPLYYACLCGHEELVQYLLENGARCEANTFDGERCLYGALTDAIKNLLKRYNVISSKMLRRDLYDEFLRKLLDDGMYADIVFHIHGETFPAHRCILSVRCPYFYELFCTRWKGRRDIYLKNVKVVPKAFRSILQYIYSGYMEIHIDNVNDCVRLAKQCHIESLLEGIDEKMKKLQSFETMKPSLNITTLRVEQPMNCCDLQKDLGHLADAALPEELCSEIYQALGHFVFESESKLMFTDICFCVEGHKYLCHKAFFCARSDYFKALLIDHFGETGLLSDDIPMVTLHDVTADIFTRVMYYLYQDSCDLTKDVVYDVLCVADLYLLNGLKRMCANCISKYLEVGNIVQVLQTSRLFSLPRLEDQCAEFMANNLDEIVEQEEFADMIKADAASLLNREETDTVDIVDSIRFHISNFVQTFSDMEEANEKHRLLDDLLDELNIDA